MNIHLSKHLRTLSKKKLAGLPKFHPMFLLEHSEKKFFFEKSYKFFQQILKLIDIFLAFSQKETSLRLSKLVSISP